MLTARVGTQYHGHIPYVTMQQRSSMLYRIDYLLHGLEARRCQHVPQMDPNASFSTVPQCAAGANLEGVVIRDRRLAIRCRSLLSLTLLLLVPYADVTLGSRT